MYKLKCNNKIISKTKDLLEAKTKTLLTLKREPSLKLIEVLNDNDEIVFSKEVDEPTPQEVENGIDSLIRNLISKGWESINDYQSAIVTLQDEDIDPATIDILNEIIDDTYVHIGALESCLSDYDSVNYDLVNKNE